MIDLVVIVGQTASGKSSLAMQIAKDGQGEIINADSRAVYKGLDIGTAKPTLEDQQKIKHHLIDIVGPADNFNVAQFQKLAFKAMNNIHKRHILPIMVGGSGLYVDSIICNYVFDTKKSADLSLRHRLESLTIDQLQYRIKNLNLEMPQNYKNKRYLIRTLERGHSNQVGQSANWRQHTLVVGLYLDKAMLVNRIKQRLDSMIKAGVLSEIKWALQTYPSNSEALKSNIYTAFRPYFDSQCSFEEACVKFIKLDMLLAKKQLTWFKRHTQIKWFDNQLLAYNYIIDKLNIHKNDR